MLGKRGSVLLFLRGLPQELTKKELKGFVQAAVNSVNGRPIFLKAAVGNCSILRITDPTNGASEVHGLVEVHPATAAIRAIKSLNGAQLKGATLEVRRYHHRSLLRDRRQDRDEAVPGDKRRQERRRTNLKIELVNP